MALVINDRVKETFTTTGTGVITLGGAVTGFEAFSAGVGNSNTTYYAIAHQTANEFEVGLGTLNSDSSTLTRTTVISSSNSDSAVSFAAGTKDVFCTMPASKLVFEDASSDVSGPRNVTITGELDAATLDISGNADIDGTSNLDVVDIDGAVQIDATFTSGVDGQGYDTKLFGDTASAYMLWDTSADDLILGGGAGLIVPDGQLTLGATAVTSTATELNLLDGVSGLVQADLTKLAAVDATAAEINLIDGGTVRGTTAVASGDGILINDGGVMAMTNVDTVSTYFSSHNVGGGNIVTTGALNSGSITSGFGTIDTGASTITTTGLISGGSLDIDNVLINGTTIGHTDDTDLITVASGIATVAGEVSMTTLDIGGTNVTSTAAEINLIDGGTARGTDALADGDGILINDGGTMKMTNVTAVATYMAGSSASAGFALAMAVAL